MKKTSMIGAAALCSLAGLAQAQPTIDGSVDAIYGSPLWIQTNPTQFGNAGSAVPCDPALPGGDVLAVTTGFELAIPLSAIGNPAGPIGILVAVNGGGHNYLSNQLLPPLPGNSGNLGGNGSGGFIGNLSGVDLTTFAGTQHIFVSPVAAASAPVIDGTLDAGLYGLNAQQVNRTRFGNSNLGQVNFANGSELNALYTCVSGGVLYIFCSGNAESNGNKMSILIDSKPTGSNPIPAGQPNGTLENYAGMIFDAGFAPDYLFTPNTGGDGRFYVDGGEFGVGFGFIGGTDVPNVGGTLSGGTNPDGILAMVDNSNTAGADGPCPPPAGSVDSSNGSELDGLYAYVDSSANRLYVMLTGNLQNDTASPCDQGGNKMMLFFDADGAGAGQNTLVTNNVDISYGALNKMAPLTFDAGFFADYFMAFKTQGAPGAASQVMDSAVLRTGGKLVNGLGFPLDYGAYDGANKPALIAYDGFYTCNGNPLDPAPQTGFDANLYTNFAARAAAASLNPDPNSPVGTANLISATINNSNIAGVSDTDASGAAAVTTGLELSIDLTELGWDGTSCIKIAGFINNSNGDYLSNQVVGSLPAGSGNLGGDGNGGFLGGTVTVNFANIAGQQYVEICPTSLCPCSADFDGSGGTPDAGDIDAFFSQWLAGGCD
jgi:hypothetical protein